VLSLRIARRNSKRLRLTLGRPPEGVEAAASPVPAVELGGTRRWRRAALSVGSAMLATDLVAPDGSDEGAAAAQAWGVEKGRLCRSHRHPGTWESRGQDR
jgi:hypothetical protein